jgi:hypothetical protein
VAELLKAGSTQAAKDLTTDSDSVQKDVAVAMTELATYQGRGGVFGKAFVKANAKTMAPSMWWEQYGKGTPNLTAVACSVLAQPVCASAAERNWSIYGSIKTDKRSRLKHETADKLVYCHEALALRTKREKVGYSQVVLPWDEDSDSDSDESEDDDFSALTV